MGRRLQVAGVFFVPAHDDLGCLACYSVHASACTGGSPCRVCGSAGDRGRSGIASRTALLLGRRKRARANHGSGGSGCGGNTVGFDCTGLAICAVYQGTGISGLAHDGDGDLWAAKGTMITDESPLQPGTLCFSAEAFRASNVLRSMHEEEWCGMPTTSTSQCKTELWPGSNTACHSSAPFVSLAPVEVPRVGCQMKALFARLTGVSFA